MNRLTREWAAEPVSRDQFLRHVRGQGDIHFPCSADHEQDWHPYPIDPYSYWSIVTAKAALVRNYLDVYWPCAGELWAVNAIGTQLRDPINSELTRWRMAV